MFFQEDERSVKLMVRAILGLGWICLKLDSVFSKGIGQPGENVKYVFNAQTF